MPCCHAIVVFLLRALFRLETSIWGSSLLWVSPPELNNAVRVLSCRGGVELEAYTGLGWAGVGVRAGFLSGSILIRP
uniref:Uncharacterized protein n=1 Tax=Arundo donax TaxID=35708 RepID=A0A0A8YAP6_ARUDO